MLHKEWRELGVKAKKDCAIQMWGLPQQLLNRDRRTAQSAPVVFFPSWKRGLATRGLCMDKKAIPRLLAPAGLQGAWCPYRLWNYPVSSPVKGVCWWMSLQVFLLKVLGKQVWENCTTAALSDSIDQLLVKITDCFLALYFAVFVFLKWEQGGKRCLYSSQQLAVRTQITYFILSTPRNRFWQIKLIYFVQMVMVSQLTQ